MEHGPTEASMVKVPIMSLVETFFLLRHVQIGRYLKTTLAYRALNC